MESLLNIRIVSRAHCVFDLKGKKMILIFYDIFWQLQGTLYPPF